ncbi:MULTISPECIES: class I SAM-dependent methyltransferase [Chryseobacterium]|uniref:Ubiquinone/menaquinone biosynthesis C-methylase UbiE n=1 Tax=Chryseobacterium camelliae TaxID=1265445 RepID=A0ABU0THK8_9FLAO|nr:MULTISPECIES: class I SAM-dependent methyltransferase [Chryseobacterium]MDQ1096540.1 ubiquinone/menaquinone biosynthesis C-methylase UbiE [Chryseobacterium camelliae]MDR6132196.1 ubiquinone/menaquinone biosynthesis C-methylase UbiE [Chryseobacterium sp. SORGH_AS_1175]MDT3409600.1 ubiquinone/menaquinone biosynthesis C-methylase UbiE [Pseudacidovorax intermedius]
MDRDELKKLAQHLARPEGETGIEVGEMMHRTNIGMTTESIHAMLIEDREHILEIGHGNAAHVQYILDKAQQIQYTGIDISETMHHEAKKQNERFGSQVQFVLYDGSRLPFEDKAFDKIFTVNTVYFWKQPTAFLNEIYRVLKKHGTFILTYGQRHSMEKLPFTEYDFTLYSNDEMEELISGSPFKRMKISEKEEQVTSKTGQKTITRIYTVLTIKK